MIKSIPKRTKRAKASPAAKVSPTSLTTPIANIDEQLTLQLRNAKSSIKMEEKCKNPTEVTKQPVAMRKRAAANQGKTTEIKSMEEYYNDLGAEEPKKENSTFATNIFGGVMQEPPSSLLKVRQQGNGLNLSRAICFLSKSSNSATMMSATNKVNSMNISAIYENYKRANRSSLKALEKSCKATLLSSGYGKNTKKSNYSYVKLLQGPFILDTGAVTKQRNEVNCV